MIRKPLLVAATAFALALAGFGACSRADTPQAAAPSPATTAAAEAPAILSGIFSGRSDHVTTGGVSITGKAGNYTLVLASDFSLDGAPDPVVGFGNGGVFAAGSVVGKLQALTGTQAYALPADFDPAAHGEVYVWCDQFSVPLGVAALVGTGEGS